MQTTAQVRVTFNNPNTPACTVAVPLPADHSVAAMVHVAVYLDAHGVDHADLDYNFCFASVRALELLGTVTTL